ncbi:MAG: CHAT domain-containing protein [Verrucomicrobia bacterium]|nr:CHAT domain-containing protein [Verrucomicrobiota bacterium]
MTILVSSLHPNTADVPVLKGANDAREAKSPLPVILLPPTIPRSNDPLYPENEKQFRAAYPNLTLTLEMLPGQWKEIRQAQAKSADVVILVGGREGTRQVAWAAKQRGVPIVPIPIFGRAAKHLWELERAALAAGGRFEDCEEFSKLYDKFNADQIADLALRLAQQRANLPPPRDPRTPTSTSANAIALQQPVSTGAPFLNKCKILFLAANPEDTSQIALDREMRKIMERIRASERRDSLEMISAWAVRLEDLFDSLNRHHPHVVHFSGHGKANAGIVLHDESDRPRALDKRDLKGIFEEFRNSVRLVVLNACYTDDQADAIVDVIDAAVGFKGKVDDLSAIDFASQFYSALGFERSVQSAFNQAVKLLRGKKNVKADRFVLRHRKDVDPSSVFLLQAGHP